VITPPKATAATTAALVQLCGVPSPMTWSGDDVSMGCASGGTGQKPSGLPFSCAACCVPLIIAGRNRERLLSAVTGEAKGGNTMIIMKMYIPKDHSILLECEEKTSTPRGSISILGESFLKKNK